MEKLIVMSNIFFSHSVIYTLKFSLTYTSSVWKSYNLLFEKGFDSLAHNPDF